MNQIYFDYQDNSQSQSMAKAKSNNNNNAPISDKANNSISYLHGNNRIIAQFNDVSKQDYYGDEDDDGNNNMMNNIIPIAPKIPIAPTAVAINSNGAIRQGVMKAKRADVSTGRWTVDEQKTFVKGIEMYGKEWKKIALMIPTRTVVQIRTHAQKYFIKLARKEAIANNNPLLFNPKVSISSNPLKSSSVANVNPLPIQSSKPAMHETLSPSVSSDSDSSASSSSMKRIINNNKMQIKRNRLSYAKIPTDEVISPKIESKCIKHLDYNGNNKHQRSDGVMSDELDLSRQLLAKRQRKAQISSTSFISIANDNDKSLVHNTGLATPVSMGGERLSIINGNSFSPRNDHSGFFQKRKNKVLLPVCYEDESNEDDNQQQQQTQLHNTDSSPCGISDLFYIFPNDASHGGGYPLLPKNETNELLNMMALDGFDGDGDDNLGIITPLKQKKSSISTSRDIHGDDDDASSVGSLDDQNNNTNNRKGSFLANGDSTYSSLVAEEVLDDSVFDMTHMSSNGASNDLLISEELNVVCPSGNRKMVVMMDNNNQKEYSSSAIPQTPPRQKISVTKEMYSPVPVSLFHMPPVIGEAELNNIFDEWQSSDVTMASASY